MADFLTKLVGRTLGTAPIAQPLLIPIYAPDLALPDLSVAALEANHPAMDTVYETSDVHDFTATGRIFSRAQQTTTQSSISAEQPIPSAAPPIAGDVTRPVITSDTNRTRPLVATDDPTMATPPHITHIDMHQETVAATSPSPVDEPTEVGLPVSVVPKVPAAATTNTVWEDAAAHAAPKAWPEQQTEWLTAQTGRHHALALTALRPGNQLSQVVKRDDHDTPLVPPEITGRRAETPSGVVTSSTHGRPTQRLGASDVTLTSPGNASASNTFSQPAATPPPVPTIQVTIGRVEVRAVQPLSAVPPQQAAPAAPKLSLEEYLRSHNGGRR